MFDVENVIRKLAKNNKFQTIFSLAKEGNFNIFINQSNYTGHQIFFLNYLVFYYNVYTEIAMKYVDEIILEDEIYEDAYMYYKRKVGLQDNTTAKVQDNRQQKEKLKTGSFTWIMKRPAKK